MAPECKRVAIIQGHPDPKGGHFCHALADAYTAGARDGGHEIERLDVASLEFPLVRSREDQQGPVPDAVRRAQEVLTRSNHVVLIYPVWNGGMPALLKGFFEQTFRASFIFPDARPGEALGFSSYFNQRKALTGRSARVIATMAMPGFVYRWYFHPHTEKNTLRLSGISPIRESLIGLVEAPNGRRREKWLKKVRALGQRAR
jgi:putative NADPH-quinone reductase